MVDAGTQIPTKMITYIDNAFQTEIGNFTYEFVAPTTALPSGVNWSENSDSTGTDMGETRFYGTPSNGTEGTYTMKIKGTYPRGRPDEQMEITYVLKVLPQGTTPTWAGGFPDRSFVLLLNKILFQPDNILRKCNFYYVKRIWFCQWRNLLLTPQLAEFM